MSVVSIIFSFSSAFLDLSFAIIVAFSSFSDRSGHQGGIEVFAVALMLNVVLEVVKSCGNICNISTSVADQVHGKDVQVVEIGGSASVSDFFNFLGKVHFGQASNILLVLESSSNVKQKLIVVFVVSSSPVLKQCLLNLVSTSVECERRGEVRVFGNRAEFESIVVVQLIPFSFEVSVWLLGQLGKRPVVPKWIDNAEVIGGLQFAQ
jgi:hypothetical protein